MSLGEPRRRGAAPAAAWACLALAAWMPAPAWGQSDGTDGTGASVPVPAPASPASPPAAPEAPVDLSRVAWTLEIDAPDDLRELLSRYLDISRFVPAPPPTPAATSGPDPGPSLVEPPVPSPAAAAASTASDAISRVEINRLAAAAPAQARQLLETEGYFAAQVQVRFEEGRPLKVHLTVRPGPRTRITRTRIIFEGPLSLDIDDGKAEAVELGAQVENGWRLPQEAPFTQARWSDAKNGLLATLRAQGYPYAAYSGTAAQVDAQNHTATLFVVVHSGPLVRLGELRVEGLGYVEPRVIERLSPYKPGDRYAERTLLDFQDRLTKTGLFDTSAVTINLDPGTPGTDGLVLDETERTLPVMVRLVERSRRQTTLGVGYSDNTGPRVTVDQVDRRLLGRALVGKAKLEVGRTRQTLEADVTTHPLPDRYRNLASTAITREETSSLVVLNQKLRLGRAQDGERIERLLYYEWQRADARPIGDGVRSLASALSVNYNWIWRDLDSVVLPTQGYSASAEVGFGRAYNTSAVGDDWFSRATGRITGYWHLGQSWYGQARIQGAQAFAKDSLLPYTLLYRAGGDESVRGYGYQDIGPTADGTAVGGRVMATGSIELARPVSAAMPSLWVAGFLDAGDAAPSWDEFDAKRGWGLGVRWRSPVGPLRADLAYGEEVRRWRVHFSVGIAF